MASVAKKKRVSPQKKEAAMLTRALTLATARKSGLFLPIEMVGGVKVERFLCKVNEELVLVRPATRLLPLRIFCGQHEFRLVRRRGEKEKLLMWAAQASYAQDEKGKGVVLYGNPTCVFDVY